ncbi:signal-transducing histidine kinase; PAS/PAC domain protein [hydrothermal vent metagenome]|uniref:Signal-transducing histidine kinase PAS/PAC domain protein n=1 Tax=hydrothermal vent metagenome TaxID=652676 RepID=A0A3B1C502_9ZZZZ
MAKPLRALIVEDSADDAALLLRELRQGGYDPDFKLVDTAEAFGAELEKGGWEIIISDYSMPGFSGLEALELLKKTGVDLPFILVSGTIGEDVAVEAMKAGAHDYIMKGVWTRLVPAIKRELREAEVRKERKTAGNELKKIQQRISAILKSVGEGIIVVGTDSRIHYVNQELLNIFGYTLEELIGQDITQLMPEKYRAPHVAGLTRYLDGAPPRILGRRIELEGLKKDGTVFSLELRVEETTTEEKNIIFTGAIRDITERKMAEQALQDKDNQLNNLLSNVNAIILEGDPLNIYYVGGQVEKLLGYPREKWFEDPDGPVGFWNKLLHPKDKHKVDLCSQAIKNGRNHSFEYRMMTSGGVYKWFYDSVTVEVDKGVPIKARSIIMDITKRKQAEENLSRLSTAIECAAESVLVTDVEGVIRYVNPAFKNVSGYSPKEVLGQTPRVLKSGKQDDSYYQNLWETITHGEVWRGHVVNKRKNGEMYEEESTISPIKDSSGVITGFVAVKRDVTKEALLEKEIRQTQKMNAIGAMAGGIAHDFNNILMPIIGYATILQETGNLDAETKSYIESISNAGRRAKELIKQIMTFSRRSEHSFQPIEIYHILKEALILQRAAIPSTIRIEEDMDSRVGVIMADPTQMHQVITNLSTNAAYAMKETGGVMKITLKTVELEKDIQDTQGGPSDKKYLLFSVSDTGSGMSQDILGNIFDPFFTTKPEGEGTGMGLAVVHGIIKNHGGLLEVESIVGKGSTFKVYIPKLEIESVDTPPEEDIAQRGDERILLVDDEELITSMLKETLEKLGYHVTSFTSSVKALEVFQADSAAFDVVITDMTMPEMTGDKLSIEILKLRKDIPVIVMTGFSNLISFKKAKDIGIRELVSKPISPMELSEIIHRVMAQAE